MNWPGRKKYRNLNQITVSKSALKYNFDSLNALHPEASVCPVLKSNAYGHGLKLVAPFLSQLNPGFMMVDSMYEAYELYKLKVRTPILIMGYTFPENFDIKPLPFSYAVFDLDTVRVLDKYQKHPEIHLKVDTGMNRYGVGVNELRGFVRKIKSLKNIKISGLMSHLSDTDNPKSGFYTDKQIKLYKECLNILTDEGISPKWKHISASAGAYKVFDPVFNLIRTGLALYGINPLSEKDPYHKKVNLKPALRFVSALTSVKTVPRGSYISYCRTYKTIRPEKIGVIPAGYFEGIDRRLSNRGSVMINGKVCRIRGRVCMNLTVISLDRVGKPRTGIPVTVIDDDPESGSCIYNIAQIAGTIPYDLLVHLSPTVKRELTG